jgi:hypothetical protein
MFLETIVPLFFDRYCIPRRGISSFTFKLFHLSMGISFLEADVATRTSPFLRSPKAIHHSLFTPLCKTISCEQKKSRPFYGTGTVGIEW